MLAHEQVHFDITELFARKMKVGLSGVKPKRASVKKVISDIAQRINGEKSDCRINMIGKLILAWIQRCGRDGRLILSPFEEGGIND